MTSALLKPHALLLEGGMAYYLRQLNNNLAHKSPSSKSQIVGPVVANSFAFKDYAVEITRVITILKEER